MYKEGRKFINTFYKSITGIYRCTLCVTKNTSILNFIKECTSGNINNKNKYLTVTDY